MVFKCVLGWHLPSARAEKVRHGKGKPGLQADLRPRGVLEAQVSRSAQQRRPEDDGQGSRGIMTDFRRSRHSWTTRDRAAGRRSGSDHCSFGMTAMLELVEMPPSAVAAKGGV